MDRMLSITYRDRHMHLTGNTIPSQAVPAVLAVPLPRLSIDAAIRSSSPADVSISSTRSPPPTPACAACNSTLKTLVPSMPSRRTFRNSSPDAAGDLRPDVTISEREARLAGQVLRVVMRDLDPGR